MVIVGRPFFLVIALLVFSNPARAKFNIGTDFGIIQDQNSLSSNSLDQKSYYDFNLYIKALERMNLYFGAEYLYISSLEPKDTSAVANIVATNILLAAKMQFGKDGLYSLTLAGSPTVQATYKVSGASSEQWTGSAYLARLSLQPEIYKHIRLVAAITYYSATYTSKSQSTSSLSSQTNFSRSLFIPSVGLSFFF